MADFAKAIPFTMANEGGWQNDPKDPGNVGGMGTNMGITMKTLTAWRKQQNLPPPLLDELKSLSYSEASSIYESLFWRPAGCPQMLSDSVATIVFDAGVNCGTATVTRLLQAQIAINGGGLVGIDGVMGPNTLQALSRCDQKSAMHGLIDMLGDRYADLVISTPTLSSWLPIWRKRRSKWRKIALCM